MSRLSLRAQLLGARVARNLTGRWLFRRRLPPDLGGWRIYVTTRSDVRLALGFETGLGDLALLARQHVDKGDVVWDIGSNLGFFAFACAGRVGEAGSVHSVEADPMYADIQRRSLERAPTSIAQVDILCAAAGASWDLLKFSVSKGGHSRNHLQKYRARSAHGTHSEKLVPVVPLDSMLHIWPAPTMLKIDVEGAELAVLEGASQILDEARPRIYIECSPENAVEATARFLRAGYSLFTLSSDGSVLASTACAFNTLAVPNT